MSRCFSPLRATRTEEGIKFNLDGSNLSLPCGQCLGCRFQRAEAWTVRIMHEAQQHDSNSFVTLTYSDDNLPNNGSLAFDDVTKFFKRLRKSLNGKKISYYYCGEYGENFSRPHYHLCLFGHDFSSDRIPHRETESGTVYRSPHLEKLWTHGFSEIGQLEYDSARYVAGYVQKKVTGKAAPEHYQKIQPDGEIISIVPEQARMSRRPAIGLNWITEYTSDVYNEDCVVIGGKKLKTPAYYDKYLEKNNPTLYEQIKQTREASMIGNNQLTQDDLTRMYEVRHILNAKSRTLEGAPAQSPDSNLLEYLKNQKHYLHFVEKAKK